MLVSTPCNPAQTTPGRGPTTVNLVAPPSPVGATLSWSHVSGAAGYVIERGLASSGTQTMIASSCADAGSFSGMPAPNSSTGGTITFQDRTGGIAELTTYTYVVRAITSTGNTGWNSVKWSSPKVPYISPSSPRVNGSTVTLLWSFVATDPLTGSPVTPPTDYLITSDYGFSAVVPNGWGTHCGCYRDVLGVPTGKRGFTVTARWPPDVSRSATISATVVP
jgi:hypothetical protein